MFGIGGQELVLLMIIGLIVLGPERLPRIANQMGSWLGQARRMTRVMKRQLEEELDFNKSPTIQPPPSRQPSFQPSPPPASENDADEADPGTETDVLPRDDDDYSPEHGADEKGTGVGDDLEVLSENAKREASEAERNAIEEAVKLAKSGNKNDAS